jgi:hypothetical protein
MKKRTLAGGAVVGIVLISIFSGGLGIPGVSPSNGESEGDDTQVSVDKSVANMTGNEKKDDAKDAKPKKPTKPKALPKAKRVELVVHRGGIGIGYTDDTYRGGSIEEAVKLAIAAPGVDGFKVRIMKDINGNIATLSRLETELLKAGIKIDEMLKPRNMLDMEGEREAKKKKDEETAK